jgi:IS5 family transposase
LNHNRGFRPRKIPSLSQLNRRIASDRFQLLLQKIHERLAGDSRCKGLLLDGQAICVAGVSKDRDARKGHVPGGFGKGYKLHVIATSSGEIPVFSVMPLNTHELPVAQQMLGTLKHDLNGVLVMADGNYDAAAFHKHIHARGGFLITAPRGKAKHPVTQRQMGPARRLLLQLWDHHPRLMKQVYHRRKAVERCFANLGAIPGLLNSLPKFVRGLARVRRYVGVKICLYHAHRIAKHANAQQN